MPYYKQPPKKKKSIFGFIFGIVAMTLFGVIRDQTNSTLK